MSFFLSSAWGKKHEGVCLGVEAVKAWTDFAVHDVVLKAIELGWRGVPWVWLPTVFGGLDGLLWVYVRRGVG